MVDDNDARKGSSTRCYWNYLEDYLRPCTGGLSVVNAIGTHLRDRMKSGLIRWRMAVDDIKKWTPSRKAGCISYTW